jgi:CheY-specific phosphatase CheX/signal transduction histidine kinase
MPFVLALAASVLLTLGVQHFVVSKGMARIQARLDERATHLADIRGKAMAQGAVIAAGSDPVVQATALGALPPDNPQVLAKLALIRDKLGANNLFILSANGVVKSYFVEPGLESLTGKSLGWRPYFTGAIAGVLTVYAALGSNTRERGIYVAAPIQAETAGFAPIGVIVAKLNFDEIDRFLAEESIPVAVVSPEGIVFASNRPDWRYRVLGGEQQLYAVKNGRRASRAYEKTPPVLLALDADGETTQEGREFKLLSAPIGWADPTGAWKMVGFVDPAAIFGWPARLGTAAALFLVLMLLCAWLQARRRAHWKARQVSNLLDNSGEGFLAFDSDFIVYPEYSRACETMLGASPAGRDVAELLFGADPARADLMRETIASVLATEDPDIREAMLSLLPKEARRGDRLLAVEVRRTGEARFMAILADITEERRVAAQLELEQRHLKLVVAAISDNRGFFETVDAFRAFLARREVSGPGPAADTREVYREIHTFKGLLSQFSFPATPQVLHEAESGLARLLSGRGESSAGAACIDVEHIASVFEADLAILTNTLGEEFLAQGRTLVLSEDQARGLEALSLRLLRGETIDTGAAQVRRLLDEIVHLRKIRLADTLKSYDRFVQQVAQKLEKRVAPLVVRGEDIWIDPRVYKAFLQSLVHVFRNAVAHGLEAPEMRWECDKPEAGTIVCTMRSDGARIHLAIADDGAGLDLARLREKAQATHVPGAGDMDDDAAAELVFMDGVSTQEEVTALAGRGVGLAAVRSEAEKLGGSVEVHSTAGRGTEFRFVLPRLRETGETAAASNAPPEIESVMNSALARTCEYLASEFGVRAELPPPQSGGADALTLRDMTAVIGVGGSIDLFIALSFQDGLIQALFERMTEGMAIAPGEAEQFKRNAAGEIANIVVGHCTFDFQKRDARGIPITPPVVLESAKTIPRLKGAVFHQRRMITEFGAMDVSLVGPVALFTASLDYAS